MAYQLLYVQYNCSSTQYWRSILPSIEQQIYLIVCVLSLLLMQ